jgi:hypothetical protein
MRFPQSIFRPKVHNCLEVSNLASRYLDGASNDIYVRCPQRSSDTLALTLKLFYALQTSINCVRFEVFTAVTMKTGVFWDVTPCGSCKNRRFGGTWCIPHQGDKNR